MTIDRAYLRHAEKAALIRWLDACEIAKQLALRDKEAFHAYLAASKANTEAFQREQEAFNAWYEASHAKSSSGTLPIARQRLPNAVCKRASHDE